MCFPFRLDLSGGLNAAGLAINHDATLVDSRLAVKQIVVFDGIQVSVRILLVINQNTTIV